MRENTTNTGIVVKRCDPYEDRTVTEIKNIAQTIDINIVDVIVQQKSEDAATHIGEGKLQQVVEKVRKTDANYVIFDNQLGAYQVYNIGVELPSEVTVYDRQQLINTTLRRQAQSRTAQLQAELASLRYELPKAEVKEELSRREIQPSFMDLDEFTGNRESELNDRISTIRDKIALAEKREENRRVKRMDEGFSTVSLFGYTNSGKTTLLKRLADDLSVAETDTHDDIRNQAKISDTPFTTVDTEIQRLSMDDRDVLVTDMLGVIKDLPDWFIESFSNTFNSAHRSDLILLVVDITDTVEQIREKVLTCDEILNARVDAPVVPVFNKIDSCQNDEVDKKLSQLDSLCQTQYAVSAKTGLHVDRVKTAIRTHLPTQKQKSVSIPLTPDAMSIVSRVYDDATVESIEYTNDTIELVFKAPPRVIDDILSQISTLDI